MTPTAWVLNLHPDTLSPLAHWDALPIFDALADVGVDVVEAAAWERDQPPACVVIPGAAHAGEEDDVADLVWDACGGHAPLLVVSDEASLFKWDRLEVWDARWWVTTPRQSVHGTMAEDCVHLPRFFGEGPGPEPVGGWPTAPKTIEVSFAGQVTHQRRREAVAAIRALPEQWSTEIVETDGFMRGLPRDAYLSELARSKIVVCPSGATTADSFRVYEAIECGAVPIVESRTPDGKSHGVWDLMYGPLSSGSPVYTAGDVTPFPIVEEWTALEHWVDLLVGGDRWETVAPECQAWWAEQKANLRVWLREDFGL